LLARFEFVTGNPEHSGFGGRMAKFRIADNTNITTSMRAWPEVATSNWKLPVTGYSIAIINSRSKMGQDHAFQNPD
jgi:hypothetical protein